MQSVRFVSAMSDVALPAIFIIVMLSAALYDVRTRRIPNRLTVGAMILGLALGALSGWGGIVAAVEGLGLALLITAPLLLLGGLGGGDAKLLMAAGAFLGPSRFLLSLLPVALIGGLLAVGAALFTGQLGAVLQSTGRTLASMVSLGQAGERRQLGDAGGLAVPYGVAIALGCIWGMFA